MCPRVWACPGDSGRWCDAGERVRRLDAELGQDLALRLGELGGLLDLAGGALEGDEVEALELAAEVAPGLAGLALAEADEQQREPADQDVRADALLEAVEDRAQAEVPLRSRNERSASSRFL